MEIIFRLFMYIFPYALSVAAYVWMFKKALRVPNKIARVIALVFITGGLCYTLYKIGTTIGSALTDDRFEFVILIITTFVLFFASIAMAFGQPEEQKGN